MAPVGSWHILRRREMIILVRRFYISASCASHASWLTLMLCSFPLFTATPLTWTNRILTHWYCNYYPYHFHLRWQHFSNWSELILIRGMFSCFVFLMKRVKKIVIKRTNLTAVRIHSQAAESHWKKTDIFLLSVSKRLYARRKAMRYMCK